MADFQLVAISLEIVSAILAEAIQVLFLYLSGTQRKLIIEYAPTMEDNNVSFFW